MDAVRALVKSLDDYEITIDVTEPNGQFITITPDGSKPLEFESEGSFKCPHCGAGQFSALNGHHQGAPVIGLHCSSCETFGLVFPNGNGGSS